MYYICFFFIQNIVQVFLKLMLKNSGKQVLRIMSLVDHDNFLLLFNGAGEIQIEGHNIYVKIGTWSRTFAIYMVVVY